VGRRQASAARKIPCVLSAFSALAAACAVGVEDRRFHMHVKGGWLTQAVCGLC
jgi:hypothetical protein